MSNKDTSLLTWFNKLLSKNKSIIITWLLSYSAILLLPILISVVMFSQAINIIKIEVDQFYSENIKLVQANIDSKISELKRVSLALAYNVDLKMLIKSDMQLDEEGVLTKIYPLVEDMRQYAYLNGNIENIYVCMDKQDIVLNTSTTIDHKELYDRIMYDGKGSLSEWKDKLYAKNSDVFQVIRLNETKIGEVDAIAYIRPISFDVGLKPDAVSIIIVRRGSFIQNENDVTIINDAGNHIISGKSHTDKIIYPELTQDEGIFKIDKENMAAYKKSAENDWIFIKTIAAESYTQKAQNAQMWLITCIILCLVIGGYLIFITIKRNYYPIESIMSFISTKFGKNQISKDEFSVIMEMLSDSYNANELINYKLEASYNIFKHDYILKVLKGDIDFNDKIEGYFAGFNIEFVSGYFGVVLISIDDLNEVLNWEDMQSEKAVILVKYLILNVLNDLILEENVFYTTEYDGIIAVLFNLDKTPLFDGVNMMERVSEKLKSFFEKEFGVILTCAVSTIQEDVVNIPQAFSDAIEALKYKFVRGTSQIIRYDEIEVNENEEDSSCYYYPLEVEQQFINNIKAGNYDKVKSILEEIFHRNFNQKNLLVSQMKLVVYNILGTIVKAVSEIGDADKSVFDLFPNIEQLLTIETVMEMKDKILNILSKVCSFIQDENKIYKSNIYQDIANYVDIHYNEYSLCIVSIGQHFKMSPYYLSKLFKQSTGEGLLEYINNIRINEAKKLLINENLNINEITKEVGYSDSYTFTRTFKKIVGVSPGKFREMNKKQQ